MKNIIAFVIAFVVAFVVTTQCQAGTGWTSASLSAPELSDTAAVEAKFDKAIAVAVAAGDGVQLSALLTSRDKAIALSKETAAKKAAALAEAKAAEADKT